MKKMMIAGIVATMTITGAAANMGAASADKDIVDTAVAAGSFKTLAGANWWSIALVTFTAAVGIMALAGGFQGWLFKKTPLYERLMLLVAGVLLVYPKTLFDAIGFVLVAMVLVGQWLRKPSTATS